MKHLNRAQGGPWVIAGWKLIGDTHGHLKARGGTQALLLHAPLLELSPSLLLLLRKIHVEWLRTEDLTVHLFDSGLCSLCIFEANKPKAPRHVAFYHHSSRENLAKFAEQFAQFGVVDVIGQVLDIQVDGTLETELRFSLGGITALLSLCTTLVSVHIKGLALLAKLGDRDAVGLRACLDSRLVSVVVDPPKAFANLMPLGVGFRSEGCGGNVPKAIEILLEHGSRDALAEMFDAEVGEGLLSSPLQFSDRDTCFSLASLRTCLASAIFASRTLWSSSKFKISVLSSSSSIPVTFEASSVPVLWTLRKSCSPSVFFASSSFISANWAAVRPPVTCDC
jgi:hypothetical protein